MRYRLRALTIVVPVVLSIASAGFLAATAANADAPTVPNCPQGAVQERGGRCVNFDGTDAGGSQVQAVTPVPPRYPSSVLASTGGNDGSDQQTNVAIINANNQRVDFSKATGITQAGQVIVSGLGFGYSLGSAGAQAACSFGVKALCMPSRDSGYTPNGDVGQIGGTNWVGPQAPPWELDETNADGAPVVAQDFGVNFDPGIWAYNQPTPVPLSSSTHGQGVTVHWIQTGNYLRFDVAYVVHCVGGDSTGELLISSEIRGSGPFSMPGTSLTANSAYHSCPLDYIDGFSISGSSNHAVVSPTPAGTVPGKFDVKYCPAGSPCAPPVVAADPERWWVTTSNCGAVDEASVISDHFHETDATYPAFPDAPPCPGSAGLTALTVTEYGDGVAPQVVWSWQAPQKYRDFVGNYPQCTPDQDAKCQLGLWAMTGGSASNCYTHAGLCSQWFSDADKATKYQCTYGIGAATTYTPSQNVDLTECTVLSITFDLDQQQRGNPYGNPVTGKPPAEQIIKVVNGSDGSNGGNGADGQDGGVGDGDTPTCYPTGWSAFNPVEWIVKPLWCLLKPSGADFFAWRSLSVDFQAHAPGSLITSGGNWVKGLLNSYSGCTDSATCGIQDDEFGFVSGAAQAADGSPMWGLIRTLIGYSAWLVAALSIWRIVAGGLGTRA